MKYFLLALFSFMSLTAFAQTKLVVRSTYAGLDGKSHPIQGSGAYIAQKSKKGLRHFVATAAHASQGQNLQLSINNQTLQVIGRISDSRADIELIEIIAPAGAKPWAMAEEKRNLFYNQFFIYNDKAKSYFGDETFYPFFVGNQLGDLSRKTVGYAPFITMPLGYQNPKAQEYSNNILSPLTKTSFVNFAGVTVLRANIAPGMSGSPLFSPAGNTGSMGAPLQILSGITIQYSMVENTSYAANYKKLERLLELYNQGSRGEIVETFPTLSTKTIWKHDGQSTFRQVLNAVTDEIFATESDSSSGKAGEGGLNGDGGEGGLNGDGGEGGLNGDGGDTQIPKAFKRLLGMTFKSQYVEMFEVIDQKGNSRLIMANWAGLDFVLSLDTSFQVKARTSLNPSDFLKMVNIRLPTPGSSIYNPGLILDRVCSPESCTFSADIFDLQQGQMADQLRFSIDKNNFNTNISVKGEQSSKSYTIRPIEFAAVNLEKLEDISAKDLSSRWQYLLQAPMNPSFYLQK